MTTAMKWACPNLCIITAMIPFALSVPIAPQHIAARTNVCQQPQLNDTQQTTLDLSSYTNDSVDPSTQWDLPAANASKLSRRFLGAEARSVLESKGRGLWATLQYRLQHQGLIDNPVCGLEDRWKVTTTTSLTKIDDDSIQSLPMGVIPEGQGKATFSDLSAANPHGHKPNFLYHNLYSPEYGVIGVAQILGRGFEPEEGRAPDRWSDVTWALWAAACYRGGKSPGDLKWIIQQGTLRGKTKDIIDHMSIPARTYDNWGYIARDTTSMTFTPEDKAFYPFLSSPNVVGTLYMLTQHSNEAGRKTIEEITLHRRQDWYITIKIGPSPYSPVQEPDQPMGPVRILDPSEDAWNPRPTELLEPNQTS